MKRAAVIAAALILCPMLTQAYGPLGHEIVGAVAGQKLAGTATAKKVSELLDGINLERASLIADEIKSWDKNGPDDPRGVHFLAHPKIEQQLRDFWKANPPDTNASEEKPSHHWFHYTDVPVFTAQRYSDGKIGRGNWDIVHAIPFCIAVFHGDIAEDNPRKITRSVALILLAHLVGDIHQPLHVGAEYFNGSGQPCDPQPSSGALGDEGGNSVTLVENATPQYPRHYYHSFHAYWDLDVVRNIVIGTPDELPREQRDDVYLPAKAKLISEFVANEPKNWRTTGDPKTWAEQWANEILPIAREAHARVEFLHIHAQEKDGRAFATGEAHEITTGYREWATNVARDELHKAGWRLAELLKQIVN